jgi:hypothetical protein
VPAAIEVIRGGLADLARDWRILSAVAEGVKLRTGSRRVAPSIVAEASTPEATGAGVRVFRSNPPSSDCWSDIRDLLADRNRRMTGTVIGSELSRIGLSWSSRAIDAVLAAARRAGLLDHDRAGGGYGLTDRGRGLSLNEVRRAWGLRVAEETEELVG